MRAKCRSILTAPAPVEILKLNMKLTEAPPSFSATTFSTARRGAICVQDILDPANDKTLRRICTNIKAGTEVLFLTHHLLYLVAKQRELFGPTPALLDGEIGTWGAAARWTGAVYVQLLPWQFPALVAPLDGDISSWGAAERWTGAVYEQMLPWEIPALENGEMCIWGAATRWTGVIGMVSNKRSREDYPPFLTN